MTDLTSLAGVEGQEISPEQIRGILAQIDLDLMNLVRDGKLAALKYAVNGGAGQSTDRAANLQSLLSARDYYQRLLESRPVWSTTQASVE
ncbi:hypothetical protein [Planctomicrobium sp. SH527]|uniref:hypothetical protein n=1 Tax=Planctomicrobium sp. SH527 TaxID=3448123 RepID=UPI003F5B062E